MSVEEKEQKDVTDTPSTESESEASAEEVEIEATEETDEETTPEVEVGPDYPAQLAAMQDKLIRQAAEFENFKKRNLAETQSRLKYANIGLVKDLLPGLDNLERAISHATNGEHNVEALDSFVEGVNMAKQQFYDGFAKHNIKRFDPLGEPFDPNHHEAVGMIPSTEFKNDHVALVMQAGYKQHDRVLRPAMVQVAKNESSSNQDNEPQS